MNSNKKNLWILAEERPKREVISAILHKFAKDQKFSCFINSIQILPLAEDGRFSFTYEVLGVHCNKINQIFIKTVRGRSSFVDFLIFYQNELPKQADIPTHAIEETKTSDTESRNTGVFQRATKFIYIDLCYDPQNHSIKKVMLFSGEEKQKKKVSDTHEFGRRLLSTIGVEVLGVGQGGNFSSFESVDEMVEFKKNMRPGRKGNKPISIKKGNRITVTGELLKSNSLAHDPNIGALSLIASAIRKLGWEGEIIIAKHGLKQKHITERNKFVKVSKHLNLEIDNLNLPERTEQLPYWEYECKGEKLATIFIDLVVENFTSGATIFSNHAGCEKSYFITKDGDTIPLKKYYDREKYKSGDKGQRISIPDIIMIDIDRKQVINAEGKKYQNLKQGIEELENFWGVEEEYIKKHYPGHKIIRTIVLYGGDKTSIDCIQVGFLLNVNGDLVLGIKAPALFKDAIKNFLNHWKD